LKKLISLKLAATILIFALTLLAIFHLLILFKVLPSGIVWGGQLTDPSSNMFTLEMISLVVTLIFIILTAAKGDFIKAGNFKKFIHVGVWIMFIYFVLNIFGNLASSVTAEKLIFTPITIILAVLAFRLAIEK